MRRLEARDRKPASKTETVVVEVINTKGSADKPGRQRARNAGPDRGILATGWRSLRQMFEFKAANMMTIIAVHVPSTTVLDLGCPNAEVDSGSYQRQRNPTSFGGRRKWETCVQLENRKFVTVCGGVRIERARETLAPWHRFAVVTDIAIPWAGQFVANLKLEIRACGRANFKRLANQVIALAGNGHAMEACASATLVGLDREIEHASSLSHTLRIGTFVRLAMGAELYPSFTSARGPAIASIAVPVTEESDVRLRSQDILLLFSPPNAPRVDNLGHRAGHCNAEPIALPYWRQDSGPGVSGQ